MCDQTKDMKNLVPNWLIRLILLRWLLDLSLFLPIFAGPNLPISLNVHSMVTLGLGQAILGGKSVGGYSDNGGYQKNIYHFKCSQQICAITTLDQALSVPRGYFVAIPVPDSVSGCISDSKFGCSCYIFPHTLQD